MFKKTGSGIPEKKETDDSDKDYNPEDDDTEEEEKKEEEKKESNKDLPTRQKKNRLHKKHIAEDDESTHKHESPDSAEKTPTKGFGWKDKLHFSIFK